MGCLGKRGGIQPLSLPDGTCGSAPALMELWGLQDREQAPPHPSLHTQSPGDEGGGCQHKGPLLVKLAMGGCVGTL